MKKTASSILPFCLLLFFFISCQHEESLSPTLGKATFSLAPKARGNGGRINETATPAFVLLSIKDSDSKVIEENKKLPLFSLGSGYLSENLELKTGAYQLTQFAVLDAANKVIYATPIEGYDLAKYVNDPLPISFGISENQSTQVIPQVLAVLSEDTPESFGLAGFGFEVVEKGANLNIHLQYPELETYDSAYIVFKNVTSEIKQKLTLDNSAHTATGHIGNLPLGDWNISTSYFSTLKKDHESLEKSGTADLKITATATDLISDATGVFVKDANASIKKPFNRVDYYYYQLYSNTSRLEGFVRLPKDPTNPFVQIHTFSQNWIYAYADRVFWSNSSVIGICGFEIFGTKGDTHDRLEQDITDVTSFEAGIAGIRGKKWDAVDCMIIIEDSHNDLFLFHRWDIISMPSGGRVASNQSPKNWSAPEIEKRKQMLNLKRSK